MYLRRHNKKVGSEDYEYWSLVESVRTAKGPRQRIVPTIGKLPGLDKEERIGWEEIRRILDGKPMAQTNLFEDQGNPPSWATVNINKVSPSLWRCISGSSSVEQTRLRTVLPGVYFFRT